MTKEEINKLEEYFECYSESLMYDCMWESGLMCKWYFHKEQSEFKLVVFIKTSEVYQAGTEADTIGCELETFEELVIRFESFTRDKIDNIEIRTYEDD
jgi:hypothetical protein